MSETYFFRFEEIDPPRVRFYVEDLLCDLGEPLPIDARFALRVVLDAFSAMDRSSFDQEAQPIDAWEVHRRVENHPRRDELLRWTAPAFLDDERAMGALAIDLGVEVTVEARSRVEGEDGSYETATVSVRVREVDLLSHCVRGFNWSSAIA